MSTPNKVVHFEIPTDNTARAKTFYEKSFGWKISEYPGMGGYMGVVTTPVDDKQQPTELGGINGGMGKREGALTHPVFTIDVASIDKALATIAKNGGKAIGTKIPVGDIGFAAYFKDTEGNTIGLWQNAR